MPGFLPDELMELQLAQIDLLVAMFPGQDPTWLDESSSTWLNAFRDLHSGRIPALPPDAPSAVSLLLTCPVTCQADGRHRSPETIQLDITVPFTHDGDADEPPHPRVRLVQPGWMSKAEAAALAADVPEDEDVFATIEHIREAASRQLSWPPPRESRGLEQREEAQTLSRIWYYFPSISTRSKRDDIVRYAPAYNLTGFLLSGKPGVLCLEGASDSVDAYIKFIKTESWSDIPASHKKVSERFRERGVTRAFGDMREITDALDKRGERANRADMKLLEAWLVERGLGEAFMKVLT
ncbi:uncharacterized protein UV8b_04988 [Ustilaginoidea virens]|uniref:Small nuclear ribonucleoprotein Prp3 C-terminal domain-containing protein n=1 Tax=Ustilaginoidea virens TaxID=1159556 RepID=A0A063BTF7_USTVR|nr:uncharacterized protein UV8b_04988 [Ustilaginoidea virens]QUC20747.1 hypothetical protein UV8b_04988 [Ustilaginoidea virens]GAO19259.1 hypothetical protein UVI_02062410 [Ustilaginoidea virens]